MKSQNPILFSILEVFYLLGLVLQLTSTQSHIKWIQHLVDSELIL